MSKPDVSPFPPASYGRGRQRSIITSPHQSTTRTPIVGDVAKVTDLIDGITKASEEQAQGVDQVNTAVSQMEKVTQQNAAGAEESASAAEELSTQAATVKRMVDELSVMVGGNNGSPPKATLRPLIAGLTPSSRPIATSPQPMWATTRGSSPIRRHRSGEVISCQIEAVSHQAADRIRHPSRIRSESKAI